MSRKKLVTLSSSTPTPTPEKEAKCKVKTTDLKHVRPLTINQSKFFDLYDKGQGTLLLHGVAGSGKTFIAVYSALREVLEKDTPFHKVIIVRSAVPTRDIGFLPGDEKEKTEVYMLPYMDICNNLFPRFGPQAWPRLLEQKAVEFMTTSHVRGLTLDNVVVIVDEAQNLGFQELNSIITRLGNNSKIIFCGDFRQTDLNKKHDMSGLKKFIAILEHMESFQSIEFVVEDIVRGALCKEYIVAQLLYEDFLLTA